MPTTDSPHLASRILAIITAVTHSHSAMTLSEISDYTGLPMTTTFRILTQLTEGGAITRDSQRRYRIGPLLLAAAHTPLHEVEK